METANIGFKVPEHNAAQYELQQRWQRFTANFCKYKYKCKHSSANKLWNLIYGKECTDKEVRAGETKAMLVLLVPVSLGATTISR